MLVQDFMKLVFAVFLFLLFSAVPIGCQYAVRFAPAWMFIEREGQAPRAVCIEVFSAGLGFLLLSIAVATIAWLIESISPK